MARDERDRYASFWRSPGRSHLSPSPPPPEDAIPDVSCPVSSSVPPTQGVLYVSCLLRFATQERNGAAPKCGPPVSPAHPGARLRTPPPPPWGCVLLHQYGVPDDVRHIFACVPVRTSAPPPPGRYQRPMRNRGSCMARLRPLTPSAWSQGPRRMWGQSTARQTPGPQAHPHCRRALGRGSGTTPLVPQGTHGARGVGGRGALDGGGGGPPSPPTLQGAQPIPSHCLADAKCQAQRSL